MLKITSGLKSLPETEPTASRITDIKKPAWANIYMFLVLRHKSLHGSFSLREVVFIFSPQFCLCCCYCCWFLLLFVIVHFLAADIAVLNIVVNCFSVSCSSSVGGG